MMNVGYMWKAIVAGMGAAVTSVTAAQAAGHLTWEALAIAAMGAVGTALATFAKTNGPQPDSAEPQTEPKPEGSQVIDGYQPADSYQPDIPPTSGLPTGFPR